MLKKFIGSKFTIEMLKKQIAKLTILKTKNKELEDQLG